MSAELKRILYVEDEPDVQAVARLALEVLGKFTIEVCSSGHEALAKAPSFRPDLILLDVMMPGMDGVSTLKAFKQSPVLSLIPVIFMTAKTQPSEVTRYKELGAIDAIAKPFDPMKLSSLVAGIWSKYYGQ